MNILKLIKKIFYSSTCAFTVTIFAISVAFSFVTNDQSLTFTKSIPLSNYPPIFIFSVVVATLNRFLTCNRVPLAVRVGTHFAGYMIALYVLFTATFSLGQTSHGKTSVMFVFAVIYAIVLAVSFFVRTGVKKLTSKLERKENISPDSEASEK